MKNTEHYYAEPAYNDHAKIQKTLQKILASPGLTSITADATQFTFNDWAIIGQECRFVEVVTNRFGTRFKIGEVCTLVNYWPNLRVFKFSIDEDDAIISKQKWHDLLSAYPHINFGRKKSDFL